jgi:hypothetical protein
LTLEPIPCNRKLHPLRWSFCLKIIDVFHRIS